MFITIWLTVTKYTFLICQWIFYFIRRCFLSYITTMIFTGLDCMRGQHGSCLKTGRLTLREHLTSPWIRVAHHLNFLCSLPSEIRIAVSFAISAYKPVRLLLRLFVGALISCLLYMCLFARSVVQHILCCVLVQFFLVLCALYCQFDCPFLIAPSVFSYEL